MTVWADVVSIVVAGLHDRSQAVDIRTDDDKPFARHEGQTLAFLVLEQDHALHHLWLQHTVADAATTMQSEDDVMWLRSRDDGSNSDYSGWINE